MPTHSRRCLKVDWMVSVVSVMVLLVATEAAICGHDAIIVTWLLLMVWLGMCVVVLMVTGLVESLGMPPAAFRLLERLHGARGPLAVIK